jgi:hypothetical protein
MGLMGLYAAALYPPFVSAVTGSAAVVGVVALLTAALVEILDADLAGASAVRAGIFVSAACVIEPACVVPVAAFLPVVAAVAWPRWRILAHFAVTAAVVWFFLARILDIGAQETALPSLRDAVAPGKAEWWTSALSVHARDLRSSMQFDFLSPYAALALIAIVVATVRRMGPSRRSTAAAVWVLAIVALASVVVDDGTASFLAVLVYLFLVLLAGTGLAALAAMNPLHAGRRRMMPVAALFLLPLLVAWVKRIV